MHTHCHLLRVTWTGVCLDTEGSKEKWKGAIICKTAAAGIRGCVKENLRVRLDSLFLQGILLGSYIIKIRTIRLSNQIQLFSY